MGMGVNKAGKYDIAGAIDLVDVRQFRREEFVLHDLVSRTDGDYLAVGDEHGAVFNDAKFAHLRAAPRAAAGGGATQGQQLRRVGEKSGRRTLIIGMQIFLALVGTTGPSTRSPRRPRSG
jgi:hypothetical protein